MTKRDITMDEIVEGMARAIHEAEPTYLYAGKAHRYEWDDAKHGSGASATWRAARAALSHLLTTANITESQLIALARGDAVVIPNPLKAEDRHHAVADRVRAALKARP